MVNTHTGPIPQFSKSPTAEASPGPSSRAQQKGKQGARRSEGTPSRAQDPVVGSTSKSNPTTSVQSQQTQIFGGKTHGSSSSQSQNLTSNLANDMSDGIIRQQLANPNNTSGGDFFGLNASRTGLASGDFDFYNLDFSNGGFTRGSSQEPGVSHADLMPTFPGRQEAPQQADRGSNVNQGLARTGPQAGNHNAGASLLANVPVPSVERQLSATPTATVQGAQASTGHGTSSNSPGHQQPAQPRAAASNTEFPPGYTATNAVYRDTHGVWYYDHHDSCYISLGHRHDWDGGIYFSGDLSVTQSFSTMHQQEGIGFLLGLAAAQALHGTWPSQERLQAAAEIARGTVPEEIQRRTSVTVPSTEIVQRLMDVNGQLPGNHYYEPFTNRVVQYNMPAGLASQNGKQSDGTEDRANQGASETGRPT